MACSVKVQTVKPIITHQSLQYNFPRYNNFSAQTLDVEVASVGPLTDLRSIGHHQETSTDGPYNKHVYIVTSDHSHKRTRATNIHVRSAAVQTLTRTTT